MRPPRRPTGSLRRALNRIVRFGGANDGGRSPPDDPLAIAAGRASPPPTGSGPACWGKPAVAAVEGGKGSYEAIVGGTSITIRHLRAWEHPATRHLHRRDNPTPQLRGRPEQRIWPAPRVWSGPSGGVSSSGVRLIPSRAHRNPARRARSQYFQGAIAQGGSFELVGQLGRRPGQRSGPMLRAWATAISWATRPRSVHKRARRPLTSRTPIAGGASKPAPVHPAVIRARPLTGGG